jgi:hypothetical protein
VQAQGAEISTPSLNRGWIAASLAAAIVEFVVLGPGVPR